jgi:hypothetical protein
MNCTVIDMETYRIERRPQVTHSETADEYAKRRVRDMLKQRANTGRLSWTIVTNAAAEAARQVRMGKSTRLAIEDSIAWALRHQRPDPNPPAAA